MPLSDATAVHSRNLFAEQLGAPRPQIRTEAFEAMVEHSLRLADELSYSSATITPGSMFERLHRLVLDGATSPRDITPQDVYEQAQGLEKRMLKVQAAGRLREQERTVQAAPASNAAASPEPITGLSRLLAFWRGK